MKFQRINKDSFVTETMLIMVKFGDYLATVESALESIKLSGLHDIMAAFGQSGRLNSNGAKKLFTAHRKRFDRDMGRLCRYSAATTLYSLFEVRLRAFIEDFERAYPGKSDSKKHFAKPGSGFVSASKLWLETAPFPVDFLQPRLWKLLQDFSLIRNCIVHCHGDRSLMKNPKLIEDVVRRTRKTSFNSDGTLILEREFVFEVAERIYAFFQILFRAAGYGLSLPTGSAETFAENFAGFEVEMAKRCTEYYSRQTTNLGGLFG